MRKLFIICSIILLSVFCLGQTQTIQVQGPSSTSGPVTITLEINPPSSCSVTINPTTLSIQVNNTQQFSDTVTGCSPSTVTWKVNGVVGGDATHGTISVSGLYTAPASVPSPANVVVSVVSNADITKNASANVTITAPPPVCSVSINPTSASVLTSATQQFTATTQGCTPSTVTWQVNGVTGGNSTVGTVDGTGLYTAPASVPSPNTVTVTAVSNADNTKTASATVTINPVVTCSVGLTPQIVSIFVNNTQQFTATTSNCTPPTVFYQVNGVNGGNSTVGTINGSGLYTAPASVPSPATVTVTAVSNADNTKVANSTVTINTAAANLDELYSGSGNTWIGPTTDNGANLPTTSYLTLRTATPSPGVLHSGLTTLSTVQSAINNAACGDIVEVPAGTDLGNGTLTLPQKTPACDDSHYIWIRSSGVTNVNWPSEGTRISPCYAGVASIPNRTPYPCSSAQNLMFKITATNGSSCVIDNGDHYKIDGMNCTRTATPGIVFILVDVNGNHLILEQNWIHGVNQDGHFPLAAGTQTDVQHGISLRQSNFVGIKDNYIDDIYCTGLCSDSQCVNGGVGSTTNSGWGVYKIVNNHCSSSTEGILFGGANGPALTPNGCTVLVNCNIDVPSDGEVRLNYFYKPETWNGNTYTTGSVTPGGAGWPVEKNGLEMKTGQRWFFEGNTIENTWYHAQVGYTWSVAPVNQQSGGTPSVPTCNTCGVWDFVYRNNYAYNVAYGFAAYAFIPAGCSGCSSQGGWRIVFRNNLIDNLNLSICTSCSAGDGWEFITAVDPSGSGLNQLNNLVLLHNGITKAIRSTGFMGGGNGTTQMNNWIWQDNYFSYGNFGVGPVGTSRCDNGFSFNNHLFGLLNACVATYTMDHNIQISFIGGTPGTTNNGWPTDGKGAGNFFCNNSLNCWNGTSFANAAGFTNFNGGDSGFNPTNYIFLGTSPFHNAGHDGTDIGPNITTLVNALGPRY